MTGYLHSGYAASLVEFGTLRRLPRSGGWILVRQIPGFSYQDAIGTYPLFVCDDWLQLHVDLGEMRDELVSLAVVADPFGDYDAIYLHECFKDILIPFKEHFVVDLKSPIDTFVCKHHQRNARKALRNIHVERCDEPKRFVKVWWELYTNLINKHNIKGIQVFSKTAFTKQLSIPGIVVFRAVYEERTVAMLLWYIQKEVGYYHLGASSPIGYNLNASFALFWFAIEYFAANGLRWLNLGGRASASNEGNDGLSRFKRGWSTGTKIAYFCGHIFDHARYSEIVRVKGISTNDYFPAYRKDDIE